MVRIHNSLRWPCAGSHGAVRLVYGVCLRFVSGRDGTVPRSAEPLGTRNRMTHPPQYLRYVPPLVVFAAAMLLLACCGCGPREVCEPTQVLPVPKITDPEFRRATP